jgi:streptogramin lyase
MASMTVDRPQAIVVGADGVFGLDFWRGSIYRLDPSSLRLMTRLRLVLPYSFAHHDNAFLPEAISLGAGSVWVTTNRGIVARIDPRSLRLVKMVRLAPAALDSVVVGEGAAWAAVELGGVSRIDLRTYRLTTTIKIEKGGRTLSAGETLVGGGKVLAVGAWATGGVASNANAVARIDPRSRRVEGVTPLPGPRLTLTVGDGSLWAARVGGTTIERIDPRTGAVVARISGVVGTTLAVADGYVWTVTREGTVKRVAAE